MMIRAVRAVNTMGGLQTFNTAITCAYFGEEILLIKDSFTKCGVSNYEIAFIHYSNEKKGRHIYYNTQCIYI